MRTQSRNLSEFDATRDALRRLLIARGYSARHWPRLAVLIADALDVVSPDARLEQHMASDISIDFRHVAEGASNV